MTFVAKRFIQPFQQHPRWALAPSKQVNRGAENDGNERKMEKTKKDIENTIVRNQCQQEQI